MRSSAYRISGIALLASLAISPVNAQEQQKAIAADNITSAYVVSVGTTGGKYTADQKDELYYDGVVTTKDKLIIRFRLVPGENNIRALAMEAWDRAGNRFVKLTDPEFFKTFSSTLTEHGWTWMKEGTHTMIVDGVFYIVDDALFEQFLAWGHDKDGKEVHGLASRFVDWFKPFKEFTLASAPKVIVWEWAIKGTGKLIYGTGKTVVKTVAKLGVGLWHTIFGAGQTAAGTGEAAVGLTGSVVEIGVRSVYEIAMGIVDGTVLAQVVYGTPDAGHGLRIPGVLYIWNFGAAKLIPVAGGGILPSANSFSVKMGMVKIDNKYVNLSTTLPDADSLAAVFQAAFVAGLPQDIKIDFKLLSKTILDSIVYQADIGESYIRELAATVYSKLGFKAEVKINYDIIVDRWNSDMATIVGAQNKK